MAMFGSGSQKGESTTQVDAAPVVREAAGTVIGSTVKVEGQFNSEDNVLIEGEVVGSITTTQDLTVGEGAHIEADVKAANMYISGEIKGNLVCEGSMLLTRTARIYGDIETGILSIETGAVLQGRCTTSATQAMETPKTPEKKEETEDTEAEG